MVGSLSSSSNGTAERIPSTTATVFVVVVVAPRVSVRSFFIDLPRAYDRRPSYHVRIASIHATCEAHLHSCW